MISITNCGYEQGQRSISQKWWAKGWSEWTVVALLLCLLHFSFKQFSVLLLTPCILGVQLLCPQTSTFVRVGSPPAVPLAPIHFYPSLSGFHSRRSQLPGLSLWFSEVYLSDMQRQRSSYWIPPLNWLLGILWGGDIRQNRAAAERINGHWRH